MICCHLSGFADDTTVFSIGHTADKAIEKLNRTLQKVYDWCGSNQLTPHLGKSEAVLLCRGSPGVLGRLQCKMGD